MAKLRYLYSNEVCIKEKYINTKNIKYSLKKLCFKETFINRKFNSINLHIYNKFNNSKLSLYFCVLMAQVPLPLSSFYKQKKYKGVLSNG